jgi:hypothetical protein
MGPTVCPETSVTNHQSTPRNIPEQRRSHWHRCDNLNSHRDITFLTQKLPVTNDIQQTQRKWDTLMDIATYEMGWAIRDSLHVRGERLFILRNVQIQPNIQHIPATLSPEVKQPERDSTHSTPSTAEARNEWNSKPAPPAYLHGLRCQLQPLPN